MRPQQAPNPPSVSRGFNLGGLGDLLGGAGGTRFNQVYVANGNQRVLLSTDSADSTALANLKATANRGITAQTGQTSQQIASAAPRAGKSASFLTKYKTPIIIGGAAVAGVAVLAGVFFATR